MPGDNITFDLREFAESTTKKPEPEPEPEPAKPDTMSREAPEFLALKSTFTPSRGDMGGGFCVVFEGQTGKTVFQVFWLAKPYAVGTIIEPSQTWRKFVKSLPRLGPLDKEWGEKLQEQLRNILTVDEKRKLNENYTRAKIRQIESIIRRSFEGISQCVFSAVTDAEPVSRKELERAKIVKPLPPTAAELAKQKQELEDREKEEREERERQEAKKEGNFEGTIIICRPVVDPVKGKPSSDIAPGDIIGVQIEGEGTSALVKKYLDENNIDPLFPVVEIKETSGKKIIYVKISDDIRGAIGITKDLKMYVKESEKNMQNENKGVSFLGDLFFFSVLGAAVLALLFVIRYFFL